MGMNVWPISANRAKLPAIAASDEVLRPTRAKTTALVTHHVLDEVIATLPVRSDAHNDYDFEYWDSLPSNLRIENESADVFDDDNWLFDDVHSSAAWMLNAKRPHKTR
jgi:hypothetical protein